MLRCLEEHLEFPFDAVEIFFPCGWSVHGRVMHRVVAIVHGEAEHGDEFLFLFVEKFVAGGSSAAEKFGEWCDQDVELGQVRFVRVTDLRGC